MCPTLKGGGGGGVTAIYGIFIYIGMCYSEGYGFQGTLSGIG